MEKSTLFNVPFSPLPDLYFKAYNLANAAARLQVSVRDVLRVSDSVAFDWLVSLDAQKIERYSRSPKLVSANADLVNRRLIGDKLLELKQKLSEYE